MERNCDYAKIPMGKNDIGANTIGEYFENLLLTLWDEQEDFSGKRPFGNGGWEYDVYASLISAGVVDGSLDEEGYVSNVTYSAANDIICEMIKQIFANGMEAPIADVVPREEYDAVVSAVDNSTKEFLKLHDDYQEAKREVERLKADLIVWKQDRFNLYQRLELYEITRQKVAREIFEEIERTFKALLVGDITDIEKILAELKKKYTEGEE